MKFGVFPAVAAGALAMTAEEAIRAEESGFDSVWVGEHHGRADQCPSPLVLLSHLAACTRRVRLGTGSLLVPFYHPVRLAAEIAMLSELSEGRAIIGLSPGYAAHEFAAFGIPPEEKAGRFVDGVMAVRRLLRERDVAFDGRFFTFPAMTIPVARERFPVEIWLGVGGPKLIARAAELADRLYIGMPATLDQIRKRIAGYRAALEASGRRFSGERVAANRLVFVTEDDALRRRAIARAAELFANQYRRFGNPDALAAGADAAERSPAIIGTPDECVARLREIEAAGTGYVVVDMHCIDRESARQSMRLFAARVLPHFA